MVMNGYAVGVVIWNKASSASDVGCEQLAVGTRRRSVDGLVNGTAYRIIPPNEEPHRRRFAVGNGSCQTRLPASRQAQPRMIALDHLRIDLKTNDSDNFVRFVPHVIDSEHLSCRPE